ncbi:hypothetical protein FB567DRAFT_596969 [Paraphoma chrysanthemicola]|uniref:Uncharacterized protein n=1 Tax=Paraphoma chrysanthemicola TaxID=798071 RepID=A0A8K0QXN7_9PLEO|nr:hypothetical protein FB567DRAFT_596969 [Paraphoma chrysanthemicola]
MATFNLLPRPPGTAEGLSAEIWTMICLAQNRQDITGDFILDNSDACSLARASRTIHLQVRDGVEQRILYRPKFSLTLWSVEKLTAISRDARLRTYVKELEFGPEELNCWLENLLNNGPHVLRDWKALMNPRLRLYGHTSWPIWPVVELPNGTVKTLSVQWASPKARQNWTDKYALPYRAACADQYAFTDGLFKAIASLPNLSKIILDHRPVGPSYKGLFGAHIRPKDSAWMSRLNIDGMVLNQVGKELELLKFFAKHVMDLPKQIPFDIVVTAVEPEDPIQRSMSLLLVDADCENWKLTSSRLRSLTLDLSGCNLQNWNVGVSAMLELSSSLESFSVRNAQVSIDITTGLLYSLVNVSVQSRKLKKLHVFNALFPADVFAATLDAYAETLEDISIDQLCVVVRPQ